MRHQLPPLGRQGGSGYLLRHLCGDVCGVTHLCSHSAGPHVGVSTCHPRMRPQCRLLNGHRYSCVQPQGKAPCRHRHTCSWSETHVRHWQIVAGSWKSAPLGPERHTRLNTKLRLQCCCKIVHSSGDAYQRESAKSL